MGTGYAAYGVSVTADATAVFGVRSVSVDRVNETGDITHHASTGAWREFVSTVKNATLTMELDYDDQDAGQLKLDAALGSGGAIAFVVTLATTGAAVFGFNGIVTNLSVPAPVDGVLVYNVTVQVTGPVTVT